MWKAGLWENCTNGVPQDSNYVSVFKNSVEFFFGKTLDIIEKVKKKI
jgi:hypothetical protein